MENRLERTEYMVDAIGEDGFIKIESFLFGYGEFPSEIFILLKDIVISRIYRDTMACSLANSVGKFINAIISICNNGNIQNRDIIGSILYDFIKYFVDGTFYFNPNEILSLSFDEYMKNPKLYDYRKCIPRITKKVLATKKAIIAYL